MLVGTWPRESTRRQRQTLDVDFAAASPLTWRWLIAARRHRRAQTKWDLPAAYPASNFHTENLIAVRERRRQGAPAAS